MTPYTIKLLTGLALQTLIPFIAQQRIELFAEYPYLYKADEKIEYELQNWFAQLKHSAVAVAYCNDEPVGFLTATSLMDYTEHFNGVDEIFRAAHLEPERYFFCSEFIVLKEHRGHRLSEKLLAAMEEQVKKWGYSAVCTITEKEDYHPLKPSDYKSYDPLWISLGFVRSSLTSRFSYHTLQLDGSSALQEHTFIYWLKELV